MRNVGPASAFAGTSLQSWPLKNKNDNQTVVDCMLRDISVTGARVRLKSLFDGPKLVVLGVIGDFTRSADVMWYRNNELGLRFRDEV